LSTLSKWLRLERDAVPAKVKFQEVRLPSPATRWPVEVVSPQGWVVRLQHSSDVQPLPLRSPGFSLQSDGSFLYDNKWIHLAPFLIVGAATLHGIFGWIENWIAYFTFSTTNISTGSRLGTSSRPS
jgi:hypothetical protein